MYEYRDYLGNTVHHFDVPGQHRELKIVAEALVEIEPASELPDRLEPSAWDDLDQQAAAGDYWEMLMPSQFAQPTEALLSLIEPLRVRRRGDPLSFLRELNAADLRLVRVRAQSHARGFAHRPCDRNPQGSLPGFRAHHDRAGAARQDSLPLRQRLRLPAFGNARPVSGRRHRTPGWRRCCRSSDGWDSTRPIT